MDREGSIALEGLDEVLKGFQKADKEVAKAAMKGLERAECKSLLMPRRTFGKTGAS